MLKSILICCCSFFVLSIQAQVEVVMRVDMSSENISDQGLFVIGSFQDWSMKNAVELLPDGDNIYSLTLELAPGDYEYSFINGRSEGILECVENDICQGDCFTDNADGNKVRLVTVAENTFRQTLAAYIFNSCEETLPASIEQLKGSRNLSINPNPFYSATTLAFANPKNQSFDILLFDVHGKLVRNFPDLRGENFEINRQDLSTGIYLLTLRTDKGEVANRKLVIH